MAKKHKRRADELVVTCGLATNLKLASALITSGRVLAVDTEGKEQRVDKPGAQLALETTFRITGENRRFVSRGGLKLDAALDSFSIDVSGWVCADIGVSTGGFTDCLLQRDAKKVHAVDVGYGQIDWRLRNDPRVTLYERTNARLLGPNAFGEPVRLAVVDVSFISLALILPPLKNQLADSGEIVALVKPQFEVEKDEAPGGVVRDPNARARAVGRVVQTAEELGFGLMNRTESPIQGADGNVEVLVHLLSRSP